MLALLLIASFADRAAAVPNEVAPAPPGQALLAPGQLAAITAAQGLSSADQLPHYTLDLSISDISARYEGRGAVTWTNTTGAPQPVIPLLLHPNAPAELGAASAGSLQLTEAVVEGDPAAMLRHPRPTLAEVVLSEPLDPGSAVTITLRFGGTLRQLPADTNDLFAQAFGGLGQLSAPVGGSDYGLLGQGDGILTAASAFPQVAPYQDGSFQTERPTGIGDMAWNQLGIFEVRVLTPIGLRVVSNLVDQPPRTLDASTQLTEAAGAGVRDLVLVASRDFQVAERDVGGVRLRSWFLERDRAAGEASLADAAAALDWMARTYGAYPYTELDVVEASLSGGAGGVEFSAMVLIAGFLYRDPASSSSPLAGLLGLLSGLGGAPPELTDMTGDQRRFVVAHELAHQWSPGLVGADARRSPVVDEALAQYLAGRAVQAALGDGAGAASRDRNVLVNYALYRLMGGADGAADRPTEAFGSSLEYAALVYGKAPYLYVDLEQRLGRARLDAAIREALADRAWGVVDGRGWLEALERAGATGALQAGQRWWLEARGDEDLALDPEGRRALQLVFGEELAASIEESFSALGLPPAAFFQLLGGTPTARPYRPGAPSPEQMLELLDASP